MTDVHVTKALGIGTVEDNSPGGMAAFESWLQNQDFSEARFLLISGDLTDTGNPREWRRVDEAIRKAIPATGRVVAAPGNHDLFDFYDGDSTYERLRIYFEHAGRWCPGLTTAEFQPIGELPSLAMESIAEPLLPALAEKLKQRFIADHSDELGMGRKRTRRGSMPFRVELDFTPDGV